MKLADIIAAAQDKPARFRAWLAFATRAEAELDSKGNIKVEDLSDGAGRTVVGMTFRDEKISENPKPHEIVAGYWKYWTRSSCESLPLGVGEVVADLSLLCGMGRAAQWLQNAIADTGIPIKVDGIIGEDTIGKSWKLNADQLAEDIQEQSRDHFHRIATGTRVRFLKGWLNRSKALTEFIA